MFKLGDNVKTPICSPSTEKRICGVITAINGSVAVVHTDMTDDTYIDTFVLAHLEPDDREGVRKWAVGDWVKKIQTIPMDMGEIVAIVPLQGLPLLVVHWTHDSRGQQSITEDYFGIVFNTATVQKMEKPTNG